MPTDEQRMRERFEDWGRTYHLNLIRTRGGQYQDVPTEVAYAAWRASNAEVQVLREALGRIVHASNNWAMPVQAFDVIGKLADIARAALASGETGGKGE